MDTVDEGYFETMGIPILRGRGFLASDTADAPRVAVVNEQFAKHYWPGGDAVGKHIRLDSRAGDAGRDSRRRADDQVSTDFRKADGFRVYAAGPASYRANDLDVAFERRSAAIGAVSEGRCPYPRSEPADVADEGLRGLLPEPGRERATNCDTTGGYHGRGGPPAGHRRFVWSWWRTT